jgi:SAM-dependent methyltransferase
MPTEIEIEQGNRQRCRSIGDRNFPVLRDLKTLELGPQDGTWFTKHLLNYTQDVAVIELNELAADELKRLYPVVNVIKDDFNECLRSVGEFDAVVVYGVLYHSHVPLKILEDIANYVKPKYILLENILGAKSSNTVTVEIEEPNVVGMRFSKMKSCNIVLSLGQDIYNTALINLDYIQVDEFDVNKQDDLMGTPGELKKLAYYTTWKLK